MGLCKQKPFAIPAVPLDEIDVGKLSQFTVILAKGGAIFSPLLAPQVRFRLPVHAKKSAKGSEHVGEKNRLRNWEPPGWTWAASRLGGNSTPPYTGTVSLIQIENHQQTVTCETNGLFIKYIDVPSAHSKECRFALTKQARRKMRVDGSVSTSNDKPFQERVRWTDVASTGLFIGNKTIGEPKSEKQAE